MSIRMARQNQQSYSKILANRRKKSSTTDPFQMNMVLNLGCQGAQAVILKTAFFQQNPDFSKT